MVSFLIFFYFLFCPCWWRFLSCKSPGIGFCNDDIYHRHYQLIYLLLCLPAFLHRCNQRNMASFLTLMIVQAETGFKKNAKFNVHLREIFQFKLVWLKEPIQASDYSCKKKFWFRTPQRFRFEVVLLRQEIRTVLFHVQGEYAQFHSVYSAKRSVPFCKFCKDIHTVEICSNIYSFHILGEGAQSHST